MSIKVAVFILLGGFVGPDGYVDSTGMVSLARQLRALPGISVEMHNWANWSAVASRIMGLEASKVVVIGYSGGGSRATYVATAVRSHHIDLLITYDPSPWWQMQPVGSNVRRCVTYQNATPFFFGLGGGNLECPHTIRVPIAEEHAFVQFDRRLHARTVLEVTRLLHANE